MNPKGISCGGSFPHPLLSTMSESCSLAFIRQAFSLVLKAVRKLCDLIVSVLHHLLCTGPNCRSTLAAMVVIRRLLMDMNSA